MKPDDLHLDAADLARHPKDHFAYSRLGIPMTRFATRTAGEGWMARVGGFPESFQVVNISRIGVLLAGARSLPVDERFALALSGPAGDSTVDFYVLRCEKAAGPNAPGYLLAGLFTEILERDDLPA
jgi:hypothetical protein